jgi:hypothetical protein
MASPNGSTSPTRAGIGSESEPLEIKPTESVDLETPAKTTEAEGEAPVPDLNGSDDGGSIDAEYELDIEEEDEDEEFIAPDLNLGVVQEENDLVGEAEYAEPPKAEITEEEEEASDDDYFETSSRPQKRAKYDDDGYGEAPPPHKPKGKGKPRGRPPKVAAKPSTSLAANSSTTSAEDAKKASIMVQLGGRKSDRPKPWVCNRDGCGRGFARSSDLNRHYKIHDGVR